MFIPEHWRFKYDKRIPLEMKRTMLTKRYFCKRGVYIKKYPWLKLYLTIQDFKMVLGIKYNFSTKLLSCDYITKNYRWQYQMKFFRLYLRLCGSFAWFKTNPKKLFIFVSKAKKACYRGLISQMK